MNLLVRINKEEAMAIRGMFPRAHIAITNRQSYHKKYYLEESEYVLKFLNEFRASRVSFSNFNKGGV